MIFSAGNLLEMVTSTPFLFLSFSHPNLDSFLAGPGWMVLMSPFRGDELQFPLLPGYSDFFLLCGSSFSFASLGFAKCEVGGDRNFPKGKRRERNLTSEGCLCCPKG